MREWGNPAGQELLAREGAHGIAERPGDAEDTDGRGRILAGHDIEDHGGAHDHGQ